MPTALVHVGVAASNLERSLRFWRDVLGLEIMDERPGISVLSNGRHNFTVFQCGGERPNNIRGHGGYFHIGVQVPDLAAGLAILCDDVDHCRDYHPDNPPTESFNVEDPDGIVVNIAASPTQWLGGSEH